MTLFIASLLIYHFNMPFWWYAIAAAIWGYKQYHMHESIKRNLGLVIEHSSCRYKSN